LTGNLENGPTKIVISEAKDMAGNSMDLYEKLRVSSTANQLEIDRAYHQMVKEAVSLGAEDYIVKPFNPSKVVSSIKKCLG
jgi:DNA-binding response OmpR family regulator